MGRTKQVAHKSGSEHAPVKLEKIKVEPAEKRSKDNGKPGVQIKTEKIEIVKTAGENPRRKARKMSNPRKFESERRKLFEQDYIFPRRPFAKLVREIANGFADPALFGDKGIRINAGANDMLQTVAEQYLTNLFDDTAMIAEVAKRGTIKPEDMQAVIGIYDRCTKRPYTSHEKEYINYLLRRQNNKRTAKKKTADNEETVQEANSDDSDHESDADYDPKKDNSEELQDDDYIQQTPDVVKTVIKTEKVVDHVSAAQKKHKDTASVVKKIKAAREEKLDPASDEFDPRDL